MGASFGAYHAANTLFKHPDVFKRCFAMSGVYDVRNFMDGIYDDNLYFNNPVDYLANLNDPWALDQLASCDIHIATGTGPWERPAPTYRLSEILRTAKVSATPSTTGAPRAATTGRTGNPRCANTSPASSKFSERLCTVAQRRSAPQEPYILFPPT